MRVIIEDKVWQTLDDFYKVSIELHPTLDEVTVLNKLERLHHALLELGKWPELYQIARYKQNWIRKGYKVYYCEGIHFAFTIDITPAFERVVRVRDACHHTLYHD